MKEGGGIKIENLQVLHFAFCIKYTLPCSASSSLLPGLRLAHRSRSLVVMKPCLPANNELPCRRRCKSSMMDITMSQNDGANAHRCSKIERISRFGISSMCNSKNRFLKALDNILRPFQIKKI